MSGGLLNDLDFERKIANLSDRELMEFTARHVFSMLRTCEAHGQRITALEKQRGPSARLIAGIGAAVGGTMAGLVYGIVAIVKGT